MFSFIPYAGDCLEKFCAHSALVDWSYTLSDAFEANAVGLFYYCWYICLVPDGGQCSSEAQRR